MTRRFSLIAASNAASRVSGVLFAPSRRACSADKISDLDGKHPILMQVPPYMSALASATSTLRPAALSLAAKVLPPLPNPMIRASVVIVGEVLGVLMALGVLMDMVTSLRIRVIRVRCADVLCAVRRLFSSLTAEALSTDAG